MKDPLKQVFEKIIVYNRSNDIDRYGYYKELLHNIAIQTFKKQLGSSLRKSNVYVSNSGAYDLTVMITTRNKTIAKFRIELVFNSSRALPGVHLLAKYWSTWYQNYVGTEMNLSNKVNFTEAWEKITTLNEKQLETIKMFLSSPKESYYIEFPEKWPYL